MALTNAQLIAANTKRFNEAQIRPEKITVARSTAARLCAPANKVVFVKEAEHLATQGSTIPWWAIALIKERESGADPQFLRNIACGQPWSKKTTIVPKGRGPFKDWFAAADDALNICAPYAAHWHDWSGGGAMTIFIKYNGLGYDNKGLPSPYAYAGTTAYVRGKYTSDGHFDPNQVDTQLGCAAVLRAMMEFDPSIQLQGGPARKSPEPPKPVIADKTKRAAAVQKAGGAVAAIGGTGEGTSVATQTVPPVSHGALWGIIGFGVAVIVVATAFIIIQKRKLLNTNLGDTERGQWN